MLLSSTIMQSLTGPKRFVYEQETKTEDTISQSIIRRQTNEIFLAAAAMQAIQHNTREERA
jgi:hypothetical protein